MYVSKNLSDKYYQENKEKLEKKALRRYQNLSEEEEEKKATIWSQTLQKSLREETTKEIFSELIFEI